MKNLFFSIVLLIITNFGYTQNFKHSIFIKQGFNKVGFFNDLSYRVNYSNHRLNLGARYYSFDNFFEKNTFGFSFGYDYKIDSKNEKTFFYTGFSSAYFKENKTKAEVSLFEIMLINGVGVNFFKQFSFFYQLGIGVVSNSTTLNYGVTSKYQFYNYEMALGFSYLFRSNSK